MTGNLEAQIQHRKNILRFPPKPSIKKKGIYEIHPKTDGTPRHDGLEREVIKYVDDHKYNLLKSQRDAIKGYLTRLLGYDYTTYRILQLFYRDRLTWIEIADELSISDSTGKRRRKEAVNELKKILFQKKSDL